MCTCVLQGGLCDIVYIGNQQCYKLDLTSGKVCSVHCPHLQIKSLPPGHSEHSQPLLMKVGVLLDPKHFKKVLHHPPQEVMSHDFTDYLMLLSAKCKDYKQIKMAAELHREDVGDEDARER